MFGNRPPHPPTFGKTFQNKNVFFLRLLLITWQRYFFVTALLFYHGKDTFSQVAPCCLTSSMPMRQSGHTSSSVCAHLNKKHFSNKYLSKGMVELCIIAYVYGYSNFIDDIYEMTGSKVLLYKCDFFYIFIHLP